MALARVPAAAAARVRSDHDRVAVLAVVLEDARHEVGRRVRLAAAEVQPVLQRSRRARLIRLRQVEPVALVDPVLALLGRDRLRGDEGALVVSGAGHELLRLAARQLPEVGVREEGVDRAGVERERLLLVEVLARGLGRAEGDVRGRQRAAVPRAGEGRDPNRGRADPVARDATLDRVHVSARVGRDAAGGKVLDRAAVQVGQLPAAALEQDGEVGSLRGQAGCRTGSRRPCRPAGCRRAAGALCRSRSSGSSCAQAPRRPSRRRRAAARAGRLHPGAVPRRSGSRPWCSRARAGRTRPERRPAGGRRAGTPRRRRPRVGPGSRAARRSGRWRRPRRRRGSPGRSARRDRPPSCRRSGSACRPSRRSSRRPRVRSARPARPAPSCRSRAAPRSKGPAGRLPRGFPGRMPCTPPPPPRLP